MGIMLIHSFANPIAYIYINFLIHPNRQYCQYKDRKKYDEVAETTDSLLNEHRENCQIGLSYIKCTALRHKLLPFVKLRTQIFFNTLYRLG